VRWDKFLPFRRNPSLPESPGFCVTCTSEIFLHPLSVKIWDCVCKKILNSTSQLMLPVPFEVVPSAVSTLLPAFLQVVKAAGECLFRNACELHRRSRLDSIFSCRRPFSLFLSRGNRKKSHGERSGEYGGCGCLAQLHTEFYINSLFKSDVHSSNSKNPHWQGTRVFPPLPVA
jgi:hypothetical protein